MPTKATSNLDIALVKGRLAKIELEKREKRRTDAERCRTKLEAFIRAAWHVVEPARPYVDNWHIGAICEHLEAVSRGEIRNLLINVPPGHMKSLIVSVFWPAWEWIDHPSARGLFSSYALDLALRDSMKCRAVIESDWYRGTFNPKWKISPDQNAKGLYENTAKGSRLSISVGSKGTGFRGDLVVVDDPLNATDQYSLAKREEVIFWFDQAMSSRFNDMRATRKVIIMQRLHENDLSGHVLEQGGWDHLRLPSRFEAASPARTSIFTDPRTQEGELLFPAMFPEDVIGQAERILKPLGFAGQHQQRPAPAGGTIIKTDWFVEYDQVPTDFDEVVQSWDCAFKDLETSDYVVGQAWGRRGADLYLLPVSVREQMDLPRTMQAIRNMTAEYPESQAKYVEDKANGPAVIQMLRHEVSGLIPVNPEGGKVARAHAVTHLLESRNVYIPNSHLAPWIGSFLAECASFPAGKNDDQCDAMTQALTKLSNSAYEQFFPAFRPYGPRVGEAENAVHVRETVPEYWWKRWLSAAITPEGNILHWYWQANGQVGIYREMRYNDLNPKQFGAEIAKAVRDELVNTKTLTCWMPEAVFERAAGRSVAEQISSGMAEVLGPESAFLWELNESERYLDERAAFASRQERRERLAGSVLTLQAAKSESGPIWEHLREMLRWRPLTKAAQVEMTREQARDLLEGPGGQLAYLEAVRTMQDKVEVLPKLTLVPGCADAIQFLSGAIHDPKHPELVALNQNTALCAESLRCGMDAHRGIQAAMPQEVYIAHKLEIAKAQNPQIDGTGLHMTATKAERDYQARESVIPGWRRRRFGR